MIEAMLIAGVGGFFGTCGRYIIGVVAKKVFGRGRFLGTFCVNVIGCFLIGILWALWAAHEMAPYMKALLISGFCGGFTTFSSFSNDSYELIKQHKYGMYVLYLITSLGGGLLMVWLGIKCVC